MAVGIRVHSATGTLVSSGADVGMLTSLQFQFIQGVEIRALCRTVEFLHFTLNTQCLHGASFVDLTRAWSVSNFNNITIFKYNRYYDRQ